MVKVNEEKMKQWKMTMVRDNGDDVVCTYAKEYSEL